MRYKPGDIVEFITESTFRKKIGVIIMLYENKYVIRKITSGERYVVSPENITLRKKLI